MALKVLHPERAQSSALAERFRNEARAIAALCHPNLVALYDFGLTADARPYTAMELLQGETLDRKLEREQRLDWRKAVRLVMEACSALEVAHQAGVIHRDIKPGNLFLTDDGTLKLFDFGIAKAVRDAPHESSGQLVLGTPEYMAPEQSSGGAVDERSDLYSLGVVLCELCAGVSPDHGAAFALLPARAFTRTLPRGTPTMLEETIERATERDPEQRFQSATDMRAALAAALHEPERRRLRRRRIAYAVLGVLGLGILGGAGYGATQPELRARAFSTVKPALEQLGRFSRRGQASVVAQAEPAIRPAATPAPATAAPPAPAEATPQPDRASPQPMAQSDQMDDGETDEAAGPAEAKVEPAKSDSPKTAAGEEVETALAAARSS